SSNWPTARGVCNNAKARESWPDFHSNSISEQHVKIDKIHSPEMQCKQSLRWKMDGSSAVKVTARKANVTGKSFLIPPSPATRKFSLILRTPGRLLSSPTLR